MSERHEKQVAKHNIDYQTASLEAIHEEIFGDLSSWNSKRASQSIRRIADDIANSHYASEKFSLLSNLSITAVDSGKLNSEQKAQACAETAAVDLAYSEVLLNAGEVVIPIGLTFQADTFREKAQSYKPNSKGVHALLGVEKEMENLP